jgi:glycosyltransferase involved in cell wall biosynthesis
MKDLKILIIVPAYNEEDVIENTVRNLLDVKRVMKNIDICVINDGSHDLTKEILNKFDDITAIHLPFNVGIGGAVQTGYKYANEHGYDLAIQFDADGQHSEHELENIIQYLIDQNLDMVIGSRFLQKTDYKGSPFRRIGILYFQLLILLLTRKKITDATSGFRVVNKKVIQKFACNYPKDYPEPEVIIDLVKNGYQIAEKTVNMNARKGGKTSISTFRSFYYMLKVSLSILMRTIVKE